MADIYIQRLSTDVGAFPLYAGVILLIFEGIVRLQASNQIMRTHKSTCPNIF